MTDRPTVGDLDAEATLYTRSHRGDSIRVAHTDADCFHLGDANSVRELDVVQLRDSLGLCADCVGDPDRGSAPGEDTNATRAALLDADPDDLRADGGRPVPPGGRIDPLVCPRGHHSITVYASRVRCQTCEGQGRRDSSFDRADLIDLREEEPPLAETSRDESDVERRRREQTADADLVTDGGVVAYDCPECGDVLGCNVDDSGQRRCPDCGRAVTALVADGGDQCAECGVTTSGAFLVEVDGEAVCEDCAGVRECVRCGRSTDETTLAGDSKCRECQTRKRQQSTSRPVGQDSLDDFVTDGGRRYRCHSRKNDVATLLLTDPLFNRRLRAVMDDA